MAVVQPWTMIIIIVIIIGIIFIDKSTVLTGSLISDAYNMTKQD